MAELPKAKGCSAFLFKELEVAMKKTLTHKFFLLFIISMILCSLYSGGAEAIENIINVNVEQEFGPVNKNIFGNNFQGMDPEYHKYPWYDWVQNRAAHGGGVWEPSGDKPVSEVMEIAKDAGVSIVRYALGKYRLENLVDMYDQDGNVIERPVKYGLDEFMETMQEIGAEPVIIIPIHPDIVGGSDDDYSLRAAHAADIVEYLNSPNDGSNPNGGTEWADIRARNGHPAPFNVKYFEMGNEPYAHPNINGEPQEGGSGVDFGWGYAFLYNAYSRAMKVVDPSVKNGLYLLSYATDQRNIRILSVVRDKVDYVILHLYFNQEADMDEGMNTADAFLMNMSRPVLQTDPKIEKLIELVELKTGRTDVPFAISEYNCWHSDKCNEQLAGALLNAELLKILMKPENNVIMANHWSFSNDLYSMIQTKNFATHDYQEPIYYMKRPNYYVYEMYNKYFGDILVDTEVSGTTYDVSGYVSYMDFLLQMGMPAQETLIPYLSVNASKSTDGKKIHIIVINKHLTADMSTIINLNGFNPTLARAWILNGNAVTESNEYDTNVEIVSKDIGTFSNGDTITFPAHSMTALIFESEEAPVGWYSTDWHYRQGITVNSTVAEAELSNFPVLIKITDGNNAVFTHAQGKGKDIIFTLSDGHTKLDHEIERFDSSAGGEALTAWVRIPTLSFPENTYIYMYYGSDNAYYLEHPGGVWDSSFTMVQHLDETSYIHIDSTENNNDYYEEVIAASMGDTSAGKIGGADRFANSSDRVTDGEELDYLFQNNVGTMEVWMKPAGIAKSNTTLYKLPAVIADCDGTVGIFRGIHGNKDKIWVYNVPNEECVIEIDYSQEFQADEWIHIVWQYTAGKLYGYKNGDLYYSVDCSTGIGNGTGLLNIGRVYGNGIIGTAFSGIIDEVRTSNVARSPEWIKATYNIQNNPESYLTFGNEEFLDTDGDGLSDKVEVLIGTNPRHPDTDHDKIDDGQEVSQGNDPLDIFSPNIKGWNLSRNADFLITDTTFLSSDMVHILVWNDQINAGNIKKDEYKFKSLDVVLKGTLTPDEDTLTYSSAADISTLSPGQYTFEFWIEDWSKAKYKVSKIPVTIH